MKRFFIVLITGVGIISAIALYFIFKDFDIDKMTTTERMTFFLQVLAGFVTACISTWGLTIAHRQIKHWEIEKCDKLWKEFYPQHIKRCELVDEWNAKTKKYNKDIDETSIMDILNFWEDIALLEKKSYLDRDIFYDRFYPLLFTHIKSSHFDDCFKKSYKENKHTFCHTRTLYIKWKERSQKDKENKDLEKSWDKMWKLINEAREK